MTSSGNPSLVTLYKNHKNKIGFWRGWTEGPRVIIEYATGVHDSAQRVEELVLEGKQGRSVNEQAVFRLTARVNSKLDSGYTRTYEEAMLKPTDSEGKRKPMLAQKLTDYKGQLDENNTFVQLKYNGHRCLITNDGGTIFAYSRNGKVIPGIDHILKTIEVPEGAILDGEVYRKGLKLQQIASLAKKAQPASVSLQFIAYDTILDDSFDKRYYQLSQLYLGEYAKLAPTKRLNEIESLGAALTKSITAGYEGLMIRTNDTPYEDGRRSKSLLKLKQVSDAEFVVVDILASRDGWGILVCQLPNASTFKVSAPGTMFEKTKVLQNKDQYIGKLATIEYAELTMNGVPFHPVCTGFREDL